jgi:hypothetical protein
VLVLLILTMMGSVWLVEGDIGVDVANGGDENELSRDIERSLDGARGELDVAASCVEVLNRTRERNRPLASRLR